MTEPGPKWKRKETPPPDPTPKPANPGCGCGPYAIGLAIIAGLWLIISMLGGGSNGGSSGGEGGAGSRELYPTTAEVACERVVRDQLGGRPSFDHTHTTAIDDGFKVYGTAALDGDRVGYICTVTGPEGSHTTTVELNR